MIPPSQREHSYLRIFRCERCTIPCVLTRPGKEEVLFCPADRTAAEWKLITSVESPS